MKTNLLLIILVLFTGCSWFPGARIHGGTVQTHTQTGASLKQRQSDDPKDKTNLAQESERVESIVLPANSFIKLGTNEFKLSSNATYSVTTKDKVSAIQGGAQKNVLGETVAKLASLRWLTWVGLLMFVFGLASAFYPPLKLIINSVTTSAAMAGGGILLIALPSLIVGHELLIFAIIGGAVGVYYFAHRHGSVSAELKTVKAFFVSDKTDTKAP